MNTTNEKIPGRISIYTDRGEKGVVGVTVLTAITDNITTITTCIDSCSQLSA